MKRPSFQFYPADWRNDAALRMCSLSARGLWWEMLCIMHTCEPYGHLIAAERPIEPEDLARIVGEGARDVRKWLAELEKHRIFSRDADGNIYCRRMVRDETERSQWRERQAKSRGSHSDVTPSVTVDVTPKSRPSSTSSSSPSSTSEEEPSLRSGTSPPEVEIQSAIEAYNAIAGELGWSVAQKTTPKRRAALKRRLADSGGLQGWLTAMAKARGSPFLRGEGGRTKGHEDWKPDLDFFLQETTFTKLMEGKYDGSGRTKTHRNSAHENFAAGARSLIDEFSGDRDEDIGGGDRPNETGVPLLAP